MLIVNGTLATMDKRNRLIPDGALLIEGDRIVAMGTSRELRARHSDEQVLDAGGRLVMPVGPRGFQDLVLVRRQGDQIAYEKQAPVAFVPLIGEHGW